MRITKVHAKDIYGIEGEKEYDLDDKVIGLFGHNGVGKSSFLHALNFAISGTRTPGIIHEGSKSGAVMFTCDNGFRVDRSITCGNGSTSVSNWMNKKKASGQKIQQEIADNWQTKTQNLKVLSSKDLEESLSKDAGRILLSYADDRLSKDDILSLMEETLAGNSEISAEDLTAIDLPESIGWEDAKEISSSALSEKRKLRSDISALKAVKNSISYVAVGTDAPTPEAAKEELEKIRTYEVKTQEDKKRLSEYEQYEKHRSATLKEIADTKAKLPGEVPDLEALKKERESLIKEGNAAREKKAAAEAVIRSLSPIYDKLGTGHCPLWSGIKCGTDMTGAKEDIRKQIAAAQNEVKEFSEKLDQMQKRYTKLKELAQKAENAKLLKEKISALEKALPPEQSKPAVSEIKDYTQRKEYLAAVISNAEKKVQADAADKDIQKKTKAFHVADFVATAFSEKGVVVSKLLSMYLDTLTEAAGKAEKETGVGVVFSYDNGLKISYRVGNGVLRPYESLSSGEAMLAFLTVSDLLHRIASIPVLVLDNLDRLDTDNLDRLLTLLDRVKGSYENIILAGVDHEGVKEVLDKHGIKNILGWSEAPDDEDERKPEKAHEASYTAHEASYTEQGPETDADSAGGDYGKPYEESYAQDNEYEFEDDAYDDAGRTGSGQFTAPPTDDLANKQFYADIPDADNENFPGIPAEGTQDSEFSWD